MPDHLDPDPDMSTITTLDGAARPAAALDRETAGRDRCLLRTRSGPAIKATGMRANWIDDTGSKRIATFDTERDALDAGQETLAACS